MYIDIQIVVLFGKLLKEGPLFHRYGTFTFRDDMPSSQQWEKGKIVPEAVGLAFHLARQTLVSSVVPHLRVFAATFGTLLILLEPGPEIGRLISALGAG